MPNSRKCIVDCVSLGEPRKKMGKNVETIRFVIHDFRQRTEPRGESLFSPIAKAHGYKWKFEVYPKGHRYSSDDEIYVSCSIHFAGDGSSVTASVAIRCKLSESRLLNKKFVNNGKDWGFRNFILCEEYLDDCLEEDGSLALECDIQIADEDRRLWYPKKLESQYNLVDLYEDASSETSDVVFAVGNASYQVHKRILALRCKKLYEIAEESGDDTTPIPIHSTRKEIFKIILDSIYTAERPEIESEEVAIELLVAADLYDCVQLKLYVESVLVDKFLKAESAASMFILADSHSCALLKEAATSVFLADADSVKKTRDWPKVEESMRLLKEFLDASLRHRNRPRSETSTKSSPATADNLAQMDVTTLRDELRLKNLEVDGTREVLVRRLETHRSEKSKP